MSAPKRFRQFMITHRDIGSAYSSLSEATEAGGPLEGTGLRLVKFALAVGMRHEGAVHAHARRALDAGCTADELRHVVLLATTTLGFPAMMAAYSWLDDVLAERGLLPDGPAVEQ